jgi:hypothetical protein
MLMDRKGCETKKKFYTCISSQIQSQNYVIELGQRPIFVVCFIRYP